MKITTTQVKILKFIHILFAGIWLACVLLLLLLPLVVSSFSTNEEIYLFNKIYHFIDLAVLSPAAVITLITGLMYSTMTSWGFFKHGWLTYKWIITILIVGSGTFFLGPMVSNLLEISKTQGVLALENNYYIRGQIIGLSAAIINFLLLTIAVLVSVFKPKKSTTPAIM